MSHHPFQLDHPDWSPIWHVDPEAAARTRGAFFDESIDDGRLIIAGHWPYPGFGTIESAAEGRVLQPIQGTHGETGM